MLGGINPPTLALSWTHGWLAAVSHSLATSAVAYHGIRRLPLGGPRLVASLPVLVGNSLVPWVFDPATHTIGTAVLFCIVGWVASFRLVMLCFGAGPYADPWVTSTFARFAAVAALPVRVRPVSAATSAPGRVAATSAPALSWLGRAVGVSEGSPASGVDNWSALAVRSVLKTAALAAMLRLYDRRETMPAFALHALHSANLYLFVTAVLEALSAVAIASVGVELDPVFDKPFLAASFQEFWARRWNLVISNLLREAVYEPVVHLLSIILKRSRDENINRMQTVSAKDPSRTTTTTKTTTTTTTTSEEAGSRKKNVTHLAPAVKYPAQVRAVGVMASFIVSGIMHELAVFYMCYHVTGEMLLFFTLHGALVVSESALRIKYPSLRKARSRFGKAASVCFTVSLALLTGEYLFWAPILHYKIDIVVVEQIRRGLGVD